MPDYNTLYFDKFRGIRAVNAQVSPFDGVMSAVDASNVDLRYSRIRATRTASSARELRAEGARPTWPW